MTYALAAALGLAAVVMLARLIRCWLSNPPAALEMSSHDPALFPQVMAGRYLFMAFLMLAALLSGSFAAIAVVFAGFAFLGLYDSAMYARAGLPKQKHLEAGLASLAGFLVTLVLWAMT